MRNTIKHVFSMFNHKNYNFLACDWFKNVLFPTNSLAKLLSDIPLTNRVRGPYRKLRTEFYGPSAKRAGHKSKGKKRGSVTYSTDRENEVSKIFVISLVCV